MTGKKINWKKRVENKAFWVAIIPASLLFVQTIAAVFGITLNLSDIGTRLLDVCNALFAVLAIMGVVIDPSTPGISDGGQQ